MKMWDFSYIPKESFLKNYCKFSICFHKNIKLSVIFFCKKKKGNSDLAIQNCILHAQKNMWIVHTVEWSLYCKNWDTSKIKLCGQILCYGGMFIPIFKLLTLKLRCHWIVQFIATSLNFHFIKWVKIDIFQF